MPLMRTERRSHQCKMVFTLSCEHTRPSILLFFRVPYCSYSETRRRGIHQKMPVGHCSKSSFVAELIPGLQGLLVSYVRLDMSVCMWPTVCSVSVTFNAWMYCSSWVTLSSCLTWLLRQFLWASLFCSKYFSDYKATLLSAGGSDFCVPISVVMICLVSVDILREFTVVNVNLL